MGKLSSRYPQCPHLKIRGSDQQRIASDFSKDSWPLIWLICHLQIGDSTSAFLRWGFADHWAAIGPWPGSMWTTTCKMQVNDEQHSVASQHVFCLGFLVTNRLKSSGWTWGWSPTVWLKLFSAWEEINTGSLESKYFGIGPLGWFFKCV